MFFYSEQIKASRVVFSKDNLYRYILVRKIYEGVPVCFIMLNPSTANEYVNDPTLKRCFTYTKDWGYSEMIILNLFALRSTDPRALYTSPDPVGPLNDEYIRNELKYVKKKKGLVVCAWGTHGKLKDRDTEVLKLIRKTGLHPFILKITKDGYPAHPLYLPRKLKPILL